MLLARDIIDFQKKKQLKRQESFEKIVEQCLKKIDTCVRVSRNITTCVCAIPEFLIGYPIYDLNECVEYIMNLFITKGFNVKYEFPRTIYFSWEEKNVRTKKKVNNPIKPAPKQLQGNIKPLINNSRPATITKKNTNGKFILDMSLMNLN